MRNSTIRGMVFLAVALLTAAPMVGETVRETEFSVELPPNCTGAKKQVQNIDSPSGPIVNVTYIAQGSDGICIVGYSELTGPITEPEMMIDSGRDSLMTELATSIEMESSTDNGDLVGRTIRYSGGAARALYGRTDFVVADDRLYQVVFIGFSGDSRTAVEESPFFSSFDVKVPEREPKPEPANEVASTATDPN